MKKIFGYKISNKPFWGEVFTTGEIQKYKCIFHLTIFDKSSDLLRLFQSKFYKMVIHID